MLLGPIEYFLMFQLEKTVYEAPELVVLTLGTKRIICQSQEVGNLGGMPGFGNGGDPFNLP